MTVAAQPSRIEYLENGITTSFAVPFAFRSPGDLVVERMVSGAWIGVPASGVVGGTTGGTVTIAASIAGARLRIRRRTARTQAVDYTPNDRFPAETHEGTLDRLTMIAQEQDDAAAELSARALLTPIGASPMTLPDPATLVGKALSVLPDGRVIGVAIGDGNDPGLRGDLLDPTLGTALIRYQPVVGPAVSTSGFLDRQGVWAGAANEIQPALDYLTAQQAQAPVRLAPGQHFIMPDATIEVDAAYSFIDGNGSTLDWPILSGGGKAAIRVRGSANPPYLQATNVFERMILRGPRAFDPTAPVTGTFGIHFDGVQGGEFGPSNISIANSVVQGFGIGIRHGHNSYLNHNRNIRVFDCLLGIEVFGSTANATENIRYEGGAIYNNQLAVRQADQSGSGALIFDGTSFDYNVKFAEVNSRAALHFRDCWHEAAPYSQRPITFAPGPDGLQDGASLFWDGGRFLLSAPGGTFDYWADVPTGAACHIRPDFATRCQSATGVAFTGGGEASFLFRNSYDAHGNCIIGHTSKYGPMDGAMEADSVVDQFITADTAAVTNETTGSNLSLAKSTAFAKTGTRSLRFRKVAGGGTAASFVLAAVPVSAGEIIGRSFWYRKPGAMTGTLFVSSRWGVIDNDASGLRVVRASQTIGDVTINLPAGDTDWQRISTPGANLAANRAPRGATHALLLIVGSAVSEGDIYFDDVWMGAIGCS